MTTINDFISTKKKLKQVRKEADALKTRIEFSNGYAEIYMGKDDKPALYIGQGRNELFGFLNGITLNVPAAKALRSWLNEMFEDEKE